MSVATLEEGILFIRRIQLENMDGRDILLLPMPKLLIVSSSNPACKKKVMQSLPIRHDSIRKVYNYILPASQLDSCSIISQPLFSKRPHSISAAILAFSTTTTAIHRHKNSLR
jgi:hypothetical protein